VTNPLKNICEKLIHMHKMVNTWWCWHICREVVSVVTDQVGEGKEKKSASYGCPGVGSCNLTRSQITTIVEGGTALSGGQKVGTALSGGQKVGTATPRAVPKNSSSTLSYFGHNS
jgi:hypothetical protein